MRSDSAMSENSIDREAASSDLRQRKKQLRRICEAARDELDPKVRERASKLICDEIEIWAPFHRAKIVFAYLAMRGEVDLKPLIARSASVRWAIPRIVDKPERHLVFHSYQADRLVRHRYGMFEPDPSAPVISPAQADLIIVPGMAFTRGGWRLGYGGGYYDRLLAGEPSIPTLGVCFHALLLDEIPHGPYDLPVGNLVTESSGVIDCRAPR